MGVCLFTLINMLGPIKKAVVFHGVQAAANTAFSPTLSHRVHLFRT